MARLRKRSLFPIALSKAEAATALGVSIRVVDRAVAEGKLPIYRTPYGIRKDKILVQDIVEWIKRDWKRRSK